MEAKMDREEKKVIKNGIKEERMIKRYRNRGYIRIIWKQK